MRFFIFFLLACSLSFVAQGRVWAVIDTFETNTPPLFLQVNQDYEPPYSWYSPYGEAVGTPPAVQYVNTNDSLGGQRDIVLGYVGTSAEGSLATASVSQRSASIGFPLDYNGGCYFQWDGIDNQGTQAPFPGAILNSSPGIGSGNNPFGLSGGRMDFTFAGRAQGITLTVLADHPCFYFYDAIDSFGVKNTLQNFVQPVDDSTPVVLNVTYFNSAWTNLTTFRWTDVVAFQVRVLTFDSGEGAQAVDTSFRYLNITGYEIAGVVVTDCLCNGDNSNPKSGVQVQLFNSANTVINTTSTDVNGQYAFYGYGPGSYRVCIDAAQTRCSTSPQCVTFNQFDDIDATALRFAITAQTVLTVPSDVTIECGACSTPQCLGFANVTSCSGSTTLTTWNDTTTSTNGCVTTIRRTWTSPDNTRTGTQTITIRDTQAPVLVTPAADLVQPCGSVTTDINSWLANHAGATATDCNVVTWTNNYQSNAPLQCGSVTVIFTASDPCNQRVQTSASYAITDTQAPVFSPSASSSRAECDTKGQTDQQQFTSWLNSRGGAQASDTCDTSVTYSNNNTNTLASGCNNVRVVEFAAVDDCGNRATSVATFTISDTTAPTITRQASPGSGSCNGNSNGQLSTYLNNRGGATATDNCIANDASLVWTNNYQDGSVSSGCSGAVPIIFTVTDPCGLTAQTEGSFSISDNTAPTITRQASPVVVECGTNTDLQTSYNTWLSNNGGATATDDCTAVSFSNNGTGVTPVNGCNNVYTVQYVASDACGNVGATTISTFTVRDTTVPTFVNTPTNSQSECNGDVNTAFNTWLSSSGGATGTDSCSTPVTITNDFTGTGPSLGGCGATTSVRFVVRDSCGLQSIALTANFTVVDTTPPVITTPPTAQTVECNSTTNQQAYSSWLSTRGGAQASDTCSTSVSWTNNATVGTIQSGCNVVSVVQFTARDQCNNQVSVTSSFSITDSTPPVLTRQASDRQAECNSNTGNNADFNSWRASHGGALATDNCGSVTWTDNFTGFVNDSSSCTSSTTVVFTATDACGLAISTQATYTVTDSQGPSITTPAANQVVQCTGGDNSNQFQNFLNNHGGAVAIDACTGASSLVWTYNTASSPVGCGSTLVNFTVADPCGGTDSTAATFTVIDNQNPTFTTAPLSARVECDGNGNVNDFNQFVATNAGASAIDACATIITYSNNAPAAGPVGCGTVPITITAADQCNNAVQATVSFTIVDTQPPVFSSVASDLSVQCNPSTNAQDLNSYLASYGGAVASDNCYASSSLVWTNNYSSLTTQNCTQSARIIFTVTDPCGQRASTSATYSVVDNVAPVLTTPASTTQLECNSQTNSQQISQYVQSRGGATAQDACSTNVVWTNNYISAPTPCGSPLSIVFTAADACGNTVQTTGSVQIIDSTAPIFATFPGDAVVGCDQTTDVTITGRPTGQDDCTQNVTLTYSDVSFQEPQQLLCPGDIIITRTWSLFDACGNVNSRDQRIVQEIARSTGPCSPSQCPPCPETVCCAETQERIECNPVPCNPVPCNTVECQSVPCIPQQCNAPSPSGQPQGPIPLPSNIPVPSCEPVYIYIFSDDEQDTVSVPVYDNTQQSSGALLKVSILSFVVLVLSLLF